MDRIRKVFIFSTSEDLEEYRTAARDAVIAAGCQPVMMEYFTPQGTRRPLDECLRIVGECDVAIAIVAHRYGWVPDGGTKSITWLECERAKEVLAFVVDEKCSWPAERRESWRTSDAIENGTFTPELAAEVKRNVRCLREFKEWLSGLGFRGEFTAPEDLKMPIALALTAKTSGRAADTSKYLAWLREQTGWIDIRGLQVGSGKVHRFPIRDLYTTLTTAGRVVLEESLTRKRLLITGDPGSGKTTFLRRIAQECCSPSGDLRVPEGAFPVFVRIGELEVGHRRLWVSFRRERHRKGFTTSRAMSGSGWQTGMANIRNESSGIQPARRMETARCCAGARGSTMRRTCARRSVTGTCLRAGSSISGFVVPGNYLSLDAFSLFPLHRGEAPAEMFFWDYVNGKGRKCARGGWKGV